MVGEYDIEYLSSRAEEIVQEKTANSTFFDPDAEAAMPRFDTDGKDDMTVTLSM